MISLIIRPEAELDLAEIADFSVDRFGAEVAEEYMGGLRTIFLRLRDFPELGAVFRGVKPEVRFLTYRSHKVYYDFDGQIVRIARILHHAMNAARILN